jgi:hypothetical protein
MAATPKRGAANRVSKKASTQLQHVGLDGHVHEGPDDTCGLCEALNEMPALAPEPQINPPELFEPSSRATDPPTPPELPKPANNGFEALYPEGTKLFWYHPKAETADPIPLPTVVHNQPDKVFFFDLHQVRRNPYTQMYMWMDRFEVPTQLQRHIVNTVDDREFFDMCDKWMEAVGGGATSGE